MIAVGNPEQVKELTVSTITQLPVDITATEEEFLNSLPADMVYPVLMDMVLEGENGRVQSRAFDALMKLLGIDKVGCLFELYSKSTPDWRLVCCKYLANFPDPRAVNRLCDVAQRHNDPDFRYVAVEGLGRIGDQSVISLLENISLVDMGTDYEGFPIKNAAVEAINAIVARNT